MKKRQLLWILGAFYLFIGLLLGLGRDFSGLPVSAQSNNLTVSAAMSVKDALEDIKSVYQKSQLNLKITYNFGSSGSLQQQIEQGAPVDIFLSAATKQMDALEKKKLLVPGTRKNLLSNSIVLVTPKDQKVVKKFSDLSNPQVKKISLGEPKSVPAGQYGEQVLKHYKLWESIKSKIVYGKDVRQVLTYVETGDVEAGLVYSTDASNSNKVRVAATAPTNSHDPITYPIAVIKDSKNMGAAKAFVQFLSGNQAKAIFKKYGFGT
ncbi:molybdate ABC transporter substrate-binding protein [Aphanothece sacrum]|uniref:Molybdate ABC transporter, periplasmic molybdate-binding protein n=1 Tax=Aphanothece sacrum FPU1 TaxID=1920663 RepID=A0A401IBX5_APHSA|nr:molybdate ABC transporter substrate-binding protein [Aphanothece sacrum]GBF78730.1 molybdate ABC transporter, periplasmic molybdate-binding protein [Aphanothece sacrum FPU1]GBF86964.1 molybdenum ABC transporter, periplasmic molybdate-binding protein [Aphanothece sacrum FPU3]